MSNILILIICFFFVIIFSGCSIEKPKEYKFNITTLENQKIMLTKENNFETINKNNIYYN